MQRNRISRPWYDHEKYQLWVAYGFSASNEIIGAYLNRTDTAVNKQIERYGIRGMRLPNKHRKIKTIDDLRLLMIQCGLDKDTLGLERSYTRSWKPSLLTIETLTHWGLKFPAPWQPKKSPKQDPLPKKSGIGRRFRYEDQEHATLAIIANYLIRLGDKVNHISPKAPHSCSYSLNGVPVKEYTLLVRANKRRLEKGEPIFIVEGITSE